VTGARCLVMVGDTRAPPEHRGCVDGLTIEEELRFLEQACARDGRTG